MVRKIYIISFILVIIISISLVHVNKYKKNLSNNTTKTKLNNILVKNNYQNNILEDKNVKIIAHRGQCFGETENSLKAIQSSINCKVDYAEIDVQETKDGVVVLMHNRSLRRLTGLDKNVDQLTYNQIEKLNIAPPFHKKGVERIPTLDEVIKKCNCKLHLIIEIKPYWNTVDLTNKVVNIIDDNNYVNQCKIHSLSYEILLNVKRLNSNIQTGYIVYSTMNNLSSLNVDFYSVQENVVNKKIVNEIHNAHKEIYAWTVDDTVDMNNLIRLNVDGIISDKPQMLLNIKKNNRVKKI